METTMYDNLLQLPLFQGLSKDDFTNIIERVRLHFLTFKKGEIILSQDKPCDQLIFMLNGEVTAKTTHDEAGYSLSETFNTPQLIEPQSLFGMHKTFKATYQAKKDSNFLAIDKSFIFSELINYDIFRLNFFNILSNRCQTLQQKLWTNTPSTLQGKIVHFILMRCQMPYGEKTLHITMDHLGKIIDETRINVSRTLNEWQEKGWIQLKRKEILIPKFETLLQDLL